jgi:hypothetical protein
MANIQQVGPPQRAWGDKAERERMARMVLQEQTGQPGRKEPKGLQSESRALRVLHSKPQELRWPGPPRQRSRQQSRTVERRIARPLGKFKVRESTLIQKRVILAASSELQALVTQEV